jgi:hypothetical protein
MQETTVSGTLCRTLGLLLTLGLLAASAAWLTPTAVAQLTTAEVPAEGRYHGSEDQPSSDRYPTRSIIDRAAATEETVELEKLPPDLTSPNGSYRWRDAADQLYSEDYRAGYDYSQASVRVTYDTPGDTLAGTLSATNLKPNFAYQLKLRGYPGTLANEDVGLTGRWWEETWSGSAWTNGHNLNDKGDGSSPNPNDLVYFARRDTPDPSSPTGLKYRHTGYLLFDYFITDEQGNATLSFDQDSSYHVLWKTAQRSREPADGPLKTATFDADDSAAYPDSGGDDFPQQSVGLFGEWERLPAGGVHLPTGNYMVQVMLTEESFHGSGGDYAGSWAAAMGADMEVTINAQANARPTVADIPDQTIDEGASFAAVTLDDYVTDADHTPQEMTWSVAGNVELQVSIEDRVASIATPDADWNGSETLTFTATDPEGDSDGDVATFTVNPVNEPPAMHVEALAMLSRQWGPWHVVVTFAHIVDADGQPVSGATVDMDIELPSGWVVERTGSTQSQGWVWFFAASRQEGTYTATVTDVAKADWIYDSDANEETSESLVVP